MTPDPLVLLLSRLQFALTVGFHYIFVPLTIGLAVCVAAMDTLRVTTANHDWRRAARYWNRFFVLAWLVGMATGYPLRMQLEQQWSGYSVYAREVLHAVMGMEGVIAPVMVTLVLALAFVAHCLTHGLRALARWLLAFVLLGQAASIVTLNAWMQHPVGTEFAPGGAQIVSLQKIFLSPTALCKVAHTVSAGLLTGAVFIAAVSAFYLMRRRHLDVARASLMLALPMAACSLAMVVWSGHASGRDVMRQQPMKFAAMEAHWEQGEGPAALTLLAVPDMDAQANRHAIEVPGLLSWVAVHGNASLPGVRELVMQAESRIEAALREPSAAAGDGWRQLYDLTARTRADWEALTPRQRVHAAALASRPSVPTVFASFRVMVGCALVLALVLGWAIVRRRALVEGGRQPALRMLCLALPLPWLATFAGWTVAEVGRQPWIIHEQMTTASAAVLPGRIDGLAQLAGFGVAYVVIGVLAGAATVWLVRAGPRRLAWPTITTESRLRRSGERPLRPAGGVGEL